MNKENLIIIGVGVGVLLLLAAIIAYSIQHPCLKSHNTLVHQAAKLTYPRHAAYDSWETVCDQYK